MKHESIKKYLVWALLAFAGVVLVGQAIGHPLPIPPDVLAGFGAAGMLPIMGDTAEPTILDIKKMLDEQGRTFQQFKETNDALIKAKAEGKAVGDLEAKLTALEKRLTALDEMKAAVDKILLQSQRPGGADSKAQIELEQECKQFNLQLASDYAAKGKRLPDEVSVDGYVQYKSAFFDLVRHGNIEKLSPEQRKAMSAGSDPDGGYMLPPTTVGRTVAKMHEQSVMRQIADVMVIGTNDLEGMSDNDEADAGWVSEMGARNDTDTPQVGKYRIEAHEMYAQPKATQKILDDAALNVETWLANKVANKFARVEGDAFVNGNGVGKPRGLYTYSTVATGDDTRAWGVFQHVITGAAGDFHTTKADPLQDLLGAFKNQYLANAQWHMRREVRTKIRKMKEATSDRYLWEPSLQAGQPDRLLGYGVRIDQYVPTIAVDSLSLAFGDFREAYTIVDRLGIRTLRDPFTDKPYVKFYTTKRTGGGAINFEAVKFLKFAAA